MVNEEGDIQLRSETEYERRLSQTAYLQPRVEITANVTDSEKYRRESGLSNLRVGCAIDKKSVENLRRISASIGIKRSVTPQIDYSEKGGKPMKRASL